MAIQIITTTLPNGTVGVSYSQTIETFGSVGTRTFSVDSGTLPAGVTLAALTGVLSGTPSAAATYNFVIEVDDDGDPDTQAFTVRTYAPLAPDPDDTLAPVAVEAGGQVDFSATGGSGNYVWGVEGGNLINPTTGLMTAINGGNTTVTLTDTESGQVVKISVSITSQSQFCVTGESAEAAIQIAGNACCEFNVECGGRLQLRIPSFHIVENGVKAAVVYGNLVQAVTGEASLLRTTAGISGANGNEVSFNDDAYFEIVTNAAMALDTNGDFAIGFSAADTDETVASIDHAAVWTTVGADRIVELRHGGLVEADSQVVVAEGDAVTFGVIDGALQLWVNSIPRFTSVEDFSACGNVILDIGIEQTGVTIGGYVDNITWSIVTAGSTGEIGDIDGDGVYTSPLSPISGVIKVLGTVETANFYVNIRNIQPTPRYTKPQPFLGGRRAHVWVTNKRATDTEVIRIASDGSPDALQNPGMIYLGVLEGSAKFTEEIEYQNFDNDEGTYYTAVSSEKAMLTGTFLEVRDLDKLALLMQHATLYPTVKGVKEVGVGGKTCGACDLRAVLVVESGACGSGWDLIYLPRVQNTANLNVEIGKKTNSKYELNFRVLPDTTRAPGRQLYSIYQMDNCSDVESAASCE